MLKTCNKTDKPPKPSKKAVIIILTEIALKLILEIELIPLVISSKPVRIPEIKELSICKKSKIGVNIKTKLCKMLLAFKIEIMLENIGENGNIIYGDLSKQLNFKCDLKVKIILYFLLEEAKILI